ncbi:MAG: response regulator transcription factor [Piscinibacter sp.]|uniref:response regulator n=1 Tax=Piscinibacter sp. TaxID=1903157 RepID=UPI00258745B2|nr:response regulator transcription factor [Piscinibacter sp.]MCW5665298.1 response regulator transcription factor [Piscinibacter sp.]
MPRIYLLVNDPLVAGRMRSLIDARPGWQAVGWAATLAQARNQLGSVKPDLLLADLQLPDGWISSLLDEMAVSTRYGRPRTLVVTMTLDDSQLLEALSNGADGYFVQGQSPQALVAAIEQTLAGGAEMAPTIARQVKAHFDAQREGADQEDPLRPTAPERLMLQWIADGFLPHEIARDLRITPSEVAQRVRGLYRKLQFDRRTATLSLKLA